MKHIGIVGLGNMGIGMAKNLIQAGFAVVGFDLRAERGQMLVELGGESVDSLADLARAVEVVFVMVLNGQQVLDVVTGEQGLMHTLPSGATVIVTATIEPAEMRQLDAILADSDINLIDSPVSGGKAGADNGSLTLMTAAKRAVFDAHRDTLDAVGGQIFHVGESPGMGQIVKAALQAFIGVTFVGIFESLALGAKAGIKGETLYQVFSSAHVGNTPFFKNCAQLIMERRFKDTGSHIGTMYKDLGITMAMARENGMPLFAASAAYELFQAGISLYPEEDNWAIVKFLEQISKTEVTW